MVTTVTTKTREGTRTRPARGIGLDGTGKRPGDNGSRGPRPPGGGGDEQPLRDLTPHHYRIGMWVGIASILMLFMALTSAYVFRAASMGWQPASVPRMLWASTALILASSAAFEIGRRSLKRENRAGYRRWLGVAVLLGLGFLAAQLLAWRELVGQGIYLASNPHSSFFYLLTGLHGLHLAGGICGLVYLLARANRVPPDADAEEARVKRLAAAEAVGVYWHFMDGLWVYLFALLFLWR